jgi:ribonuclease P protein subunit RPR2
MGDAAKDPGVPTQDVDTMLAELIQLRREVADQRTQAVAAERQLERYAADLRATFIAERERTEALHRSYMATVRALSNAVEARDAYTGRHAERVAAYGLEIARAAGSELAGHPEIEFGFLLHDVGKVAVPDAILYKPEPLSAEERRLMQRHPVIGDEILRDIHFLGEAKAVVRSHHERWDGSGYPDGLKGTDIPLAARVFAVADTLDALTTDRPYRPASPLAEGREAIAQESGSHFDPEVVTAFLTIPEEVLERIRREEQ